MMMDELPVSEVLDRIEAHQDCGMYHPMTCGNDSRHPLLVGREVDGRPVLFCKACGYTQTHIPSLLSRAEIEAEKEVYPFAMRRRRS